MEFTQRYIEDPIRNNPEIKPPSIASKGASQGGMPKETPRSEPRRNPMKSAPQSKPFTNAKPLRVPIVEAYPDELQPVNPFKNDFLTNQIPRYVRVALHSFQH